MSAVLRQLPFKEVAHELVVGLKRIPITMDPERCVVNLRTRDWRTRLLQRVS